MKLIDFISLEHDFEEIDDKEDFYEFMENANELPQKELPITMDATEISRIIPSVYNSNWTDVYLKDGDLLTAIDDFLTFKIKWLEALGIFKQKTFTDVSSWDQKMEFRYYNN